MADGDDLFTISCIGCNNQIFQFSQYLLIRNEQIVLQCPKCKEDTKVTYDSISGITIGKY